MSDNFVFVRYRDYLGNDMLMKYPSAQDAEKAIQKDIKEAELAYPGGCSCIDDGYTIEERSKEKPNEYATWHRCWKKKE